MAAATSSRSTSVAAIADRDGEGVTNLFSPLTSLITCCPDTRPLRRRTADG